jgi:DNA-binding Lrp family transcriptional regulator
MAVWNIRSGEEDEAGKKMARHAAVSHCYLRQKTPAWQYNLYTMIHAKSEGEASDLIKKLSDETGCRDYRLLRTIRELKKTGMTYF